MLQRGLKEEKRKARQAEQSDMSPEAISKRLRHYQEKDAEQHVRMKPKAEAAAAKASSRPIDNASILNWVVESYDLLPEALERIRLMCLNPGTPEHETYQAERKASLEAIWAEMDQREDL
jgi:hypothetical protein